MRRSVLPIAEWRSHFSLCAVLIYWVALTCCRTRNDKKYVIGSIVIRWCRMCHRSTSTIAAASRDRRQLTYEAVIQIVAPKDTNGVIWRWRTRASLFWWHWATTWVDWIAKRSSKVLRPYRDPMAVLAHRWRATSTIWDSYTVRRPFATCWTIGVPLIRSEWPNIFWIVLWVPTIGQVNAKKETNEHIFIRRDTISVWVNTIKWNRMGERHSVPLPRLNWVANWMCSPTQSKRKWFDGCCSVRWVDAAAHSRIHESYNPFWFSFPGWWLQRAPEQTDRFMLFILDRFNTENTRCLSFYKFQRESRVSVVHFHITTPFRIKNFFHSPSG